MPLPMNLPPAEFARVPAGPLQAYAADLLGRAGLAPAEALLIAERLVDSDLRGVHSHGTWQVQRYVTEIRDGAINPRPVLRLLRASESTAVLDGDGGLGYVPAWEAAHLAVRKARQGGLAAVATRYHGHIGAAGHYSRVCAAADCLGIAASAVNGRPGPGVPIWVSQGGAPISMAVPSGREAPLVPDMGAYLNLSHEQVPELFARLPDAFVKVMGLGVMAQALGALVAGTYDYPPPGRARYGLATQGAFVLALDVTRFLDLAEFKRQVDLYVEAGSRAEPLPGHARAEFPGGPEWRREQEYRRDGVPVSPKQRAALDAAAAVVRGPTLDDWLRQASA